MKLIMKGFRGLQQVKRRNNCYMPKYFDFVIEEISRGKKVVPGWVKRGCVFFG